MSAIFDGINSTGTLVLALTAAYSVLANGRRAKGTHEMVRAIDKAVNGKPAGSTTMVTQVQELHDEKFPPPEEVNGHGDAVLPLLKRVALDVAALKEKGAT